MNIKLNWIRIKNFKGIKEKLLTFNGQNASIYGDNATYKTTTMDSWNWLLFGKDSNDNTAFTVKPQDKFGNDIHHLQTEVEGELLIDGTPLRLKKMQEEKWTTKRGSDVAELTGNTTSYWYNEVPVKAGEYKEKIDGLINENIFKMITNPLFFNTKLSWQERRKMLLEICGDATQEQVIASDKSLSKLTEVLNGRSIDDYKAVLADKLKDLKKERDDIPPRIDELTLSLPQEEPDYSGVEKELQAYKETLQGIELLLTNATTKSNEINKKYQELAKLNTQLEEVKNKINLNANKGRRKLIEDEAELEEGKLTLETNIKTLKETIKQKKETIESDVKTRENLLKEWKSLKLEKQTIIEDNFIEPSLDSFKCPTCKQDLPQDDIENKIAEMKKNFENTKKSKLADVEKRLEENKTKGLNVNSSKEKCQKVVEESETEIASKEKALADIKAKISKIQEELNKPKEEPDYSKDAEYIELSEKINNLQTELEKPVEDKSSDLVQKKTNIQTKIDECNKTLNSKEETAKKRARIEELKAEEKRVSALIAEFEGHKFLLERFVVAKVNLLEDSINSQFKHVKFKLFEENVTNDGIKETCIALVNTNGSYVKYEDGNLAGQINAGLDIIQSLCKFYEVSAPIFIDNRESVSEIMAIYSQIINLIKPPTWDELDKAVQYKLAGIENYEQPSMLDMVSIEKAKKAWNDRNNSLRVEIQE